MKKFMDKDFLLTTKMSEKLFHEAAAAEPIFDYHCHLIPSEIAENRRYANIAEMWLGGDHYKWRALRANGIDERLITGDAEPFDKFMAWAETVPMLLGNPLYHWTHLELQRYFGIDEPLNKQSARSIWDAVNKQLQNDPHLSVFGIFKKFNVFALGTTDDPADDLAYHQKIRAEGKTGTKVTPSFRPDNVLNIDKDGFAAYAARLGKCAGKSITSLGDMLDALGDRVDYFDKHGCLASDHDLKYPPFETARDGSTGALWEEEVSAIFKKVLDGGNADKREAESYKTYMLCFLAGEYNKHGWAMQFHLSVMRSINTVMTSRLGPNTGYDVVHDHQCAEKLAYLLNEINSRNALPKTILYSLNPKDYFPLATIMGSFQGEFPGKMQLGSGWWFLDNKDGMGQQMKILANVGLLSRFVGMLTDSRSFLSYPRHEYFRRILCDIIGRWAQDGEVPNDWELLSAMVKNIAFGNAKDYFTKA
jgi:glucuronate isomerase